MLAAFSGVLRLGALQQRPTVSNRVSRTSPSLFLQTCATDNVIGVLLATDIRRHQAYIEGLRKKHSFYLRLKYGSTNKFRVAFAVDVLSYFFSDPDLTFVARVQEYSFGTDQSGDVKWIRVVGQQVRELVNAGIAGRPSSERLVAQHYIDISSPGGKDRKALAQYLLTNLSSTLYVPKELRTSFPPQTPSGKKNWNHKTGLSPRSPRPAPNDLGELAAFLTGAAGALILPPSPRFPAVRNGGKVKLRQVISAYLGPKNRWVNSYRVQSKFRVLVRTAA
jgi:hypothetical protein